MKFFNSFVLLCFVVYAVGVGWDSLKMIVTFPSVLHQTDDFKCLKCWCL